MRPTQHNCLRFGCSQDYFRDLTAEDFLLLVPNTLDPGQDEALTVPLLGRDKYNEALKAAEVRLE